MLIHRALGTLAGLLCLPFALTAYVLGEPVLTAEFDAEASYVLVNQASGEVVDIQTRGVVNLTNLALAPTDGATYQMWRFAQQGNGSWYLFNRANDKVILVDGGSKEPGARVVQDRNRNSLRNAWDAVAHGDGSFRLINRNSALALAAPAVAGGGLIQATVADDPAQRWIIRQAVAPQVETHDFSLQGFATVGPGVTGGAGGETVIVRTVAELKHHLARPEPVQIFLLGEFDLPSNPDTPHSNPSGRMYTVASNKTIIGLPGAVVRSGGFNLARVSNIIIRNITFTGAADDCINMEHGTTHVWVDHNDFSSSFDGLVDIKRESDFITVSWNRFSNHDKTCLLGHDDNHTADRGHLRVTYHHNWFVDTEQRLPRVRYGRPHVFNNYYQSIRGYTAGIGVEARIISENNYIDGANSGYTLYDKAAQPGYFREINSVYSRLNNDLEETSDSGIDWEPADYYAHTANHVLSVPELVRTGAGVGIIDPFELGGGLEPVTLVAGPADRTVNLGTSTTFTVQVTGVEPLTYVWYFEGALIQGANTASHTLNEIQPAQGGTYRVVVSDVLGGEVEASAVLTVDPTPIAPYFAAAPQPQSVFAGGTAVFNAGANGTAPLSYVWHKDGEVIAGVNGATLTLTNVTAANAAVYTVTATNTGGSAISPEFFLAVPPAPATAVLQDAFADGSRGGQSLPASAAWWTSSGSSNFTATTGVATQSVGSSRTILAYFTNSSASPLSLSAHQRLSFDFNFRFSGFDSAQPDGTPTLRVGLLRSVANPSATSGTGFSASGSPNTQARVNGDFGSNNPSNGPFLLYQGYAALTAVQASGTAVPVVFGRRDGSHLALLGSTDPYTTLAPAVAPVPSNSMATGTDYRGSLVLTHTGAGIELNYEVVRVSDGAVVMAHSAVDPAATFTLFDTVGFQLSKHSSSSTYNFVLTGASVTRENLPLPGFDGWLEATGLPLALRGAAADPDRDGISNLMEYVFGGDAVQRGSAPMLGGEIEAAGNRYLSLAFTRREDLGNVELAVEAAPRPDFAEVWPTVEVLRQSRGDGLEDVVYRSSVPMDVAPVQFLRLRASIIAP